MQLQSRNVVYYPKSSRMPQGIGTYCKEIIHLHYSKELTIEQSASVGRVSPDHQSAVVDDIEAQHELHLFPPVYTLSQIMHHFVQRCPGYWK